MTTTALVQVFTGDNGTQLCNARDLHAVLEVCTKIEDWLPRRIEQYGFTEGEDFFANVRKTRGRPATDYHLTLDMAKELAMVENNDRGRQVRRYFIQIEKEARAQVVAGTAAPPAPAFDLRATLRAGNCTPTAPLPREVQTALNRKAWMLAHDAYELCREHLARRAAYSAEFGYPERLLDKRAALDAIAETTLDMVLTPAHINALGVVLRTMESVASMANDYRDKLAAEVEKLTAREALQ